jgi:hypothetical protein
MRKIRLYLTLSITLLIATICSAQISFKTIQKDFGKLSGTWKGSLTYLDYSSGKPYTMPADIEIKEISKSNKLVFMNIYPNETSANSIDTISFSTDGKYIDKELIKSRRKLPNGNIEIITEEYGKDGNDNKPATFRHTYTLGKTIYKKRKDVQFSSETAWINRHEYTYTKKLSK